MLVSPDDKIIKKEDFIKVMKGCKQNTSQKDIDNKAKELKFESKTTLTYDETYLMAKQLWVENQQNQQNQQKLTQEEKDSLFNLFPHLQLKSKLTLLFL
jgi:hypothetical protein